MMPWTGTLETFFINLFEIKFHSYQCHAYSKLLNKYISLNRWIVCLLIIVFFLWKKYCLFLTTFNKFFWTSKKYIFFLSDIIKQIELHHFISYVVLHSNIVFRFNDRKLLFKKKFCFWFGGGGFLMVGGEEMKNWTSKGNFFSLFNTFYPKILKVSLKIIIFPNAAFKTLKNRAYITTGEKSIFKTGGKTIIFWEKNTPLELRKKCSLDPPTFSLGNSSAGTGFPRNLHKRSQPSPTWNTSSWSAGTNWE